MTFSGALLFGILVGAAVLVGFLAVRQLIGARDPIQKRLYEFGAETPLVDVDPHQAVTWQNRIVRLVSKMVQQTDVGPRLAADIARADLSLTVGEYITVTLVAAFLGLSLGLWRFGLIIGVILAGVLGYLPSVYLSSAGKKRQQAFSEQLPDVLTLLVSALRAGYGITQAIQTLIDQLPEPASKEFGEVMRAVALGQPITQALNAMVDRMGGGEVELMVTAINIQHELGGNLSQTLETIGQTIRDRIKIKGELMVLTAQQRITGLMLAVLPIGIGAALYMINRQHISRLFEPGIMRYILIYGIVSEIVGFVVMRKMVAIEV